MWKDTEREWQIENGNEGDKRGGRTGHEINEQRDYGHVHERVEETDSTKKPPKERE